MEDMVERVARAMMEVRYTPDTFDRPASNSLRKEYLVLARAALDAMREPTEVVEDAARGLWLWYAGLPSQSGWTLGRHNQAAGYKLSLTEEEAALEHTPKHVCGRIAWRTMIDAALTSSEAAPPQSLKPGQ